MKTLDAAEMLMQSIAIFYDWNCELEYKDLTKPKLEERFKSIVSNPDKYYQNLVKLMELLKIDDSDPNQIVECIKNFDYTEWYYLENLQDDIYDVYFNCKHHDWKYPSGFDLSALNPDDLYLDDPENAHWYGPYDPNDDYDPENDWDDGLPI